MEGGRGWGLRSDGVRNGVGLRALVPSVPRSAAVRISSSPSMWSTQRSCETVCQCEHHLMVQHRVFPCWDSGVGKKGGGGRGWDGTGMGHGNL